MNDTPAVNPPDVSYARSGDVAIAYQIVGSGPLDIVFVRGIPDSWHLFALLAA